MKKRKPDKRCGTCRYHDLKRKSCTWEAENAPLHWSFPAPTLRNLTPESNPNCGLWEAQHDHLW